MTDERCRDEDASPSLRRWRLTGDAQGRGVPLKPEIAGAPDVQLADRRWLLERMADGASVYAVAKELRTGTRTIYQRCDVTG